ncbi:MAG: aldehyde ferredoxin oxidoreductase family protein [Anaerolineae bacterium]|uniref:aldehyde ferredoxin oxidoreductase family protein n=1 Tax=Promineifilum sp. TaxID=2664178 RepID=UPI001DBE7425|nr:aldehyde ferredoxin oxidoreductase family protein [Anaerolineales bacterium]MCB8934375.1 aldehyde ferredoxin oxidoreductase family protein [Promineifilum sp.]MCO5182257.1 aldehyde ferredoxin oxidoreductase family protein [Promineifilum sp.]MCW5847337.1 aldehyde ferredoxin oxidoreductase family protein [Anaerolineae bacterium]
MRHGFTGKVLHVDLTRHQLTIEEPDEAFYRLYPGGSLMGLYYLWHNTPPGIDALDPRNTLTFALSAPTGLPVSGQSRCTATCKSPTTQGVADSQAGGFWPAELKFAGFDAIVIRGASATPVYLWIHNGEAELRDAAHLWGHFTHDVDTMLKHELGDAKIEIAQIGPAGEKLSMFAAVMSMSNRAWGRTGIGAVMGSKNLRAIAVRGTQQPQPADKKAVVALSRRGPKLMPERRDVESLGRYGTADAVMGQEGAGGLPTRNWDSGVMDIAAAEAISGERLYLDLLRGAADGAQDKLGRDTCYACIVRCKRVVEAEYRDNLIAPAYGGPEYETISTFGSYCGVSDLHAISYANQLCNMYGVDSISCGATLSWAMECFEQGVLTLEDTDGIALNYGDAEAMIAMLEKTLRREGLGDVLAEGSARAAERLGRGHDYVLTVKGQEIPAHMPHVKRSLGLIYAVNPFGADHQSSEHDPMYHPKLYEGKPEAPGYKRYLAQIGLTTPTAPKAMNPEKVEFALLTQYNYSAADVLGYCQFVFGPSWQLYGPQDMADLLAAATGWDMDVDDVQAIGRRRLNLMRAYNAREGLTRDHDTLPKKLFTHPLSGGRTDGMTLDAAELDMALTMYFELAGWDVETGTPRRATLEEVGLGWVADELAL